MNFRFHSLALFFLFCLPGAAPADAAAPKKILHVLLTSPEASLDPALASDVQSLSINENIFDPPLRYDYLARPVKLQANTLRAMPEVSADGKTYLLHLQPGIFFTPDAAFKGQARELIAEDYVYSIKRLYDPAIKSPWLFMFEGKLLGDDKLLLADKAKKFNPDQTIAGLQALDRYTLRLQLKAPDNNFLFQLATPAVAAVAREVVDNYADQIGSHPVGTGPFMMGQWQRNFKMQLLANPAYRKVIFSSVAGGDAADLAIVKNLQGKRLPRVDSIEIKVIEEQQSRVLGFLNQEFDYLEQLPPPLADMVLRDGKLRPELASKGIQFALFSPLQTYYMWMNMDDPLIGGYTPEKIALRRAIALSYDSKEDIRLMEKGLALPAQSVLPPNVLGYDPRYRSPLSHDLKLANALLDKFGYQRGQDGYRHLPDGQPLSLTMHSLAATTGRLRDEVWHKNMEAIGVRIRFKTDKHSEIIKAARLGKVQMTEANWIADFPDGENFYQLLYGPNSGRANYARFNLPAFNTLYEQSRSLSDSPQRQRLYHDMAQLVHGYTPWVLRIHPLSADIWQPWLKNYKRHPVDFTSWRYVDLEKNSTVD
ncbi:MAG: ABC transporter substrate-binding protein [Undibacterium sp.]|nr:ABC transporter substrate-binding protein [Undibacterium sp.]